MVSDGYFGEEVASTYDDDPRMSAPEVVEPVVDFLADLTGGERALEFGVGTGRIAIPLSNRGIAVAGIDLSRAMVSRLSIKPGGGRIAVTIGDFATTRADGEFDLVYLVYNTIMNLTTQSKQVDCFRNASAHLRPGGCFVVEVMIPRIRRLSPGDNRHVFELSESHWGIDEYEVPTQRVTSHHLVTADGGTRRYSMPCRYVWPAELDLMAQLAGMRLRERWGSWHRDPLTEESDFHVSVWERPHEGDQRSPDE